MENQFLITIPEGSSTLSLPRNLSAINRQLITANATYRISIQATPTSATQGGILTVQSANLGWQTGAMWRHGQRLREAFMDAMAVSEEETFSDESPIPLMAENPYDEFRPYLDDDHQQGASPEIFADGVGTPNTPITLGEWDYTQLGLFGNQDSAGSGIDNCSVILMGMHRQDVGGNYTAVGLVESWLQNTNAPGSQSDREPVLDPDVDNPALLLYRGGQEDEVDDAITLISESNRTRPYLLDSVQMALTTRGQMRMDPDSFSPVRVSSFSAVGGLVRFGNATGAAVYAIITVHSHSPAQYEI
jgi:hypothetical protein